jgi:hypothetical protein
VASPKSVRAARWLTSGDPRKSEISGKRRRFSATTAFRSANSFGLIRRQFRSTTPCSSPVGSGRAAHMPERERLPNRRAAGLINFQHDRRRWTASFGRFADGRVAEVFLDGPKESPIVALAQDGALAASLALQSGCPLDTLRHALDGREAGPLEVALALIDEALR